MVRAGQSGELYPFGEQVGKSITRRHRGAAEQITVEFAYRVAVAENGPRDESKAFSLEPRSEDSGDEFTPDAEAAVETEEPLF